MSKLGYSSLHLLFILDPTLTSDKKSHSSNSQESLSTRSALIIEVTLCECHCLLQLRCIDLDQTCLCWCWIILRCPARVQGNPRQRKPKVDIVNDSVVNLNYISWRFYRLGPDSIVPRTTPKWWKKRLSYFSLSLLLVILASFFHQLQLNLVSYNVRRLIFVMISYWFSFKYIFLCFVTKTLTLKRPLVKE